MRKRNAGNVHITHYNGLKSGIVFCREAIFKRILDHTFNFYFDITGLWIINQIERKWIWKQIRLFLSTRIVHSLAVFGRVWWKLSVLYTMFLFSALHLSSTKGLETAKSSLIYLCCVSSFKTVCIVEQERFISMRLRLLICMYFKIDRLVGTSSDDKSFSHIRKEMFRNESLPLERRKITRGTRQDQKK